MDSSNDIVMSVDLADLSLYSTSTLARVTDCVRGDLYMFNYV